MEGYLRFKIDLASLIVGRKFTVFALFYFIFERDLTEGFLRYEFGGLIFGGAHTKKSLFSEFYSIPFLPTVNPLNPKIKI